VQLASSVDPGLGRMTLWTLVVVYAAAVGVPVVLFVRLPGQLNPPSSEADPAFPAHLKKLGERLATNPHLAGRDLSNREGVDAGLDVLGTRSDAIAREAAASVFLATAVSQSGRLDGLLVLAAQSRMIWKIAHLYHQRPSIRDVAHLYANVAGTVFLAGEIQDVDLAEQVEPILSSALGGLGANVPGFKVAGTILTNCVLSGSANAFLTLRVGMIAKRYCGALVVEPKTSLRRAATSEAARHLGGIVADGSGKISRALWKASVAKVGDAVAGASSFAKRTGDKLFPRMRAAASMDGPELG
jgi:hypothetical protein